MPLKIVKLCAGCDADAPPDLRQGETGAEEADPVMRKLLLRLWLL